MGFEIRYYNANFKQRRYPIRHLIPMFFGTPCITINWTKEEGQITLLLRMRKANLSEEGSL